MHSPDIKGMSRTVAAVPDSHKLSSTPVADHVLSRSPVFSRTNTSAGSYAVVLFLVGVSVLFVSFS